MKRFRKRKSYSKKRKVTRKSLKKRRITKYGGSRGGIRL